MNPTIETAACRAILADGSQLVVTATRRPRASRADVKCSAPGDVRLAERMQQVVRLARHTEPRFDSRDQVVISIDRLPPPGERGWELPVVLADRMVRGLYRPQGEVAANGWSDAWELGRVTGHSLANPAAGAMLGGADGLPHLGLLSGHPDPAGTVASSRAWFPLHSGGVEDSLSWVDVSVTPLGHDPGEEEQTIAVPGQDAARQLAVRQALCGARHFDTLALGRWRTVVRFEAARFDGRSFELALVLADRMARGREFQPRGRILATGCSSAWHAGRVEAVDGLAPKCALLLREAGPGDRILLPRAWQGQLPEGFAEQVRGQGASVACVERIGII